MDKFVEVEGTFARLADGDVVKLVGPEGVSETYQVGTAGGGVVFTGLKDNDIRVATRVVLRDFRVDEGGVVTLRKAFCYRCGCLVAVVDHGDRCQSNGSRASAKVRLQRRAWVGDALMMLDVRSALLASRVENKNLTIACSRHTSGEALAELYTKYSQAGVVFPSPALGQSVKQLATAFEANYPAVRDRYLREHFPDVAGTDVQDVMLRSLQDGSANGPLDGDDGGGASAAD